MNLQDNEFLKTFVDGAPIGICILDAATFTAEMLNDKFLEIAGKPKEAILNKWYWEPFAEARAYYEEVMTGVILTGQPYYADEVSLMLIRHGKQEDIYVTFVYSPVKNSNGKITKLAVWVLENTKQVTERQRVEAARAAFQLERDRLTSFFMQAPAGICILNGPELVFELVNPSYQALMPFRDLVGRPIFQALPELVGTPLEKILLNVYATGQPYEVNELLIPVAETEGGLTKDRYFSFNYQARLDENNKVDGIMTFVFEVTATIKSQQDQLAINEELAAANEEAAATNEELTVSNEELAALNLKLDETQLALQLIIDKLPASVVVIRGEELIVEMINQSNLNYWNKTVQEVVGKPFLEILPDLADQPFASQLRQVMATGEIIDVKESPVIFENADGSQRETFVDYTYQPLADQSGRNTGVLVMSFEITDRVTARKLLEATNAQLISSEARFKFLIQEAPVAIGVLHGRKLVIESANEMILNIWGKTTAIVGQTLANALPELKGQPFLELLDEVYTSGRPFYGNEVPAMLEHNGTLQQIFLNFVYQPIKDQNDKTQDILVVAIDVTIQVNARNELQQINEEQAASNEELASTNEELALVNLQLSEAQKKVEESQQALRLAIEAADFGTWYIHSVNRELIVNARLKELFGFYPDEDLSLEQAIAQITEEYREFVAAKIENAIYNGGDYDVTYQVLGLHDQRLRWLRAIGNLKADSAGAFSTFTGVIMDVTEQMANEQRKSDFIGMVSHELKTPLTSLTAIVQMAGRKLKNSDDPFIAGAMEKAGLQVRRMSNMINGFLNISRLESAKLQIEKKPFNLSAMVTEVVNETELTVNTHQIKLTECENVSVNADEDKIHSVVTNLISNAVKYSPKGQEIEVKCRIIGNEVEISVRDEGMGLKSLDKEKVFDRYFRVENNNTQHISGFGIGLYLSAEIVRRHNGEIWVESESGKGSTFYFSLPIA